MMSTLRNERAAQVADLRALLDELLARWETGPDVATTPRGRHYTEARLKAVTALASHAHRLGRAVAILVDQEFTIETAPMVRSVLEHGLTTQWLVQYGDEAMFGVVNEAQRQRKNIGTTLRMLIETTKLDSAKAMADLFDENVACERTAADGPARRVDLLCNDLVRGDMYYFNYNYRVLSDFTHPGPTLAAAYVDSHEPPQIRLPVGEPITWLYITCCGIIWAARAADMLDSNHPNREFLRRCARKLDIPVELQLSSSALLRRAQDECDRRKTSAGNRRYVRHTSP